MKRLHITPAARAAIEAHAAECYPEECCGIIVSAGESQRVVRVTNIQNKYHARDPKTYPRTARTAYAMGPEIVPILHDAEDGRLRIHAFYHSHPDHDSYFSPEDRIVALGGGNEPSYPEAGHIVISVRDGTAGVTKAFAWDPTRRDFAAIPLISE